MKGVIFNLLEDMIVAKCGDDTLEEIYAEATFTADAPPFVGPDTYPDADLLAMVELLSRKMDTPVSDLVYGFGRYMFPELAARFPAFLEHLPTPVAFLETVNEVIHVEVKKLFEEATPPVVTIEKTADGRARLLYRSDRQLCRLVEGLLDGVGDHFNQKATYAHRQCMLDGAGECVLDIAFSS